jgi:hypothetical protein
VDTPEAGNEDWAKITGLKRSIILAATMAVHGDGNSLIAPEKPGCQRRSGAKLALYKRAPND